MARGTRQMRRVSRTFFPALTWPSYRLRSSQPIDLRGSPLRYVEKDDRCRAMTSGSPPTQWNRAPIFSPLTSTSRMSMGLLGYIPKALYSDASTGIGGAERDRTDDLLSAISASVSGHTRISPFASRLPRSRLIRTCADHLRV